MRRGPIFVAAVGLACLPAVTGLMGNQSFSHSVPVRVPSQARIGPPEAVDATIRPPVPAQSIQASPHTSLVPEVVQSLGARHDAKDDSPHGGSATPTAGGGPVTEAEPQQSADRQRGKPITGEPGDDHRSSPAPLPAPRVSENHDSGNGRDNGTSSATTSGGDDGKGSNDDRRGHH
jgi:hypothetical protein